MWKAESNAHYCPRQMDTREREFQSGGQGHLAPVTPHEPTSEEGGWGDGERQREKFEGRWWLTGFWLSRTTDFSASRRAFLTSPTTLNNRNGVTGFEVWELIANSTHTQTRTQARARTLHDCTQQGKGGNAPYCEWSVKFWLLPIIILSSAK